MIKLIDILNEIRVNDPVVTIDKVWDYSENIPDEDMDIWFDLLNKYGLEKFEKKNEGADIKYFLRSLPTNKLHQFYEEFKSIFKPIK